ncbi:MAG: AtpZ/AtpI family protein [Alphaproteobacteria bacterium]
MDDRERADRSERLAARLKAAQGRRPTEAPERPQGGIAAGMGVGAKVVVDLVAGVGLGVGIGWALDWWLGTRPWGTVAFAVLGFVAGLLNVIRTANQADRSRTKE